MTWRLENSIVRGELFNLRPNQVHGWLELQGASSLIHLGLTGNMEGELQGKRVQFETELAKEEDQASEGRSQEPEETARSDFEALEVQQIGPTGAMQLIREAGNGQAGKESLRLSLQWFSQNGEMRIDLVNPKLEFVADEEGLKKLPRADDKDDVESIFLKDDDDDFPEFPDDADEDDPYGLFPPQLEEQIEGENMSPEIAAIDENALSDSADPASPLDDPLGESPFENRRKRSWDEVIPELMSRRNGYTSRGTKSSRGKRTCRSARSSIRR